MGDVSQLVASKHTVQLAEVWLDLWGKIESDEPLIVVVGHRADPTHATGMVITFQDDIALVEVVGGLFELKIGALRVHPKKIGIFSGSHLNNARHTISGINFADTSQDQPLFLQCQLVACLDHVIVLHHHVFRNKNLDVCQSTLATSG